MIVKKSLSINDTLIKTIHYPSVSMAKGGKKVLLGLGGNIGDVLRRFEHLFVYFERSSFVHILETAPILKNPAFGYREQADFYNTLMWIETTLSPHHLLRYILRVEKVFGRKRSFANAPRTLDIDIIFYENIKLESKVLILPHPAWLDRDSILVPLSYMRT
ncbi:2-amino-4-hydroxy-6-hydroxymethyldihydropteridinepyrophosphokinase [hydrothermal vent metagenome]|uniref:2-amino-4-hydroxy-6-hydroxymethyldihydropteridine diphosphokinase n=1 Tax=hydrothermal vent metagenome TaxID=652676 RepID=A0A1W1D0U4_9ZZZZ